MLAWLAIASALQGCVPARSSGKGPDACTIWPKGASDAPKVVGDIFSAAPEAKAVKTCTMWGNLDSIDALVGPRVVAGWVYYENVALSAVIRETPATRDLTSWPETTMFTTRVYMVFPLLEQSAPPSSNSLYIEVADMSEGMMERAIEFWKGFNPAEYSLPSDLAYEVSGPGALDSIVGYPSPSEFSGMHVYVIAKDGLRWRFSYKFEDGKFALINASPEGI